MPDLKDVLGFCPGCFASSEDGSCAHVVIGDFCSNCGANDTVQIPRWAVDSIRRQASWVGRRAYPNNEDKALQKELAFLRSKHNEGVRLDLHAMEEIPNGWLLVLPTGGHITFGASSREEAERRARELLPVPIPA